MRLWFNKDMCRFVNVLPEFERSWLSPALITCSVMSRRNESRWRYHHESHHESMSNSWFGPCSAENRSCKQFLNQWFTCSSHYLSAIFNEDYLCVMAYTDISHYFIFEWSSRLQLHCQIWFTQQYCRLDIQTLPQPFQADSIQTHVHPSWTNNHEDNPFSCLLYWVRHRCLKGGNLAKLKRASFIFMGCQLRHYRLSVA